MDLAAYSLQYQRKQLYDWEGFNFTLTVRHLSILLKITYNMAHN